jgi:hypothetical protein
MNVMLDPRIVAMSVHRRTDRDSGVAICDKSLNILTFPAAESGADRPNRRQRRSRAGVESA